MATGDQSDIASRIWGLLPNGWFGRRGDSPIVEALVQGAAWALSQAYGLYTYAKAQTRVATMTGGWLELAANDYFPNLYRFAGEQDGAYSRRIRLEALRDRCTVNAIQRAVFDITGIMPTVYEGFDSLANGTLTSPGMALGKAGRWSSSQLGLNVFVAVTMHNNYGIPNRGGWDDGTGGFGDGNFSLVDNSEIVGSGATQLDVINAIERVRPAGVNIYVRFVTFGAPEDPSNNVAA